MTKKNPFNASILRILSMSSSSKKKPEPEEIIRRAMESDLLKKPLPLQSYITLHFMILKGEKPLPKVKYKWLDKKDQKLPVHGPYATNEKGWGMFSIKESDFRKLDTCRLVISEDKTSITISNITMNAIKLNTRIKGDKGYSVMFDEHAETQKTKEQKKELRDPFFIAVSGDSKQLNKAIPLLKKQSCIKVTMLLTDPKQTEKVDASDPDIRIETISKDISRKLEGVDMLLDLSNHPNIEKLSRAQMFGKRKTKTIIIPDATRFIGMEEQVLSSFEEKPQPVPDWERILNQLQKTNKI